MPRSELEAYLYRAFDRAEEALANVTKVDIENMSDSELEEFGDILAVIIGDLENLTAEELE
jgi:hypothetical protein